ncbi:MAG: putative toxin-antitoxin system toxin component, PIN family [Anaerolineae bacterium]
MSEHRLRVMADTNVLITGVVFPRAFYEFLQHTLRGDFTLVLSEQVLAEARRWMERKATPRQRTALEMFLEECEYELVPDPPREEVQAHSDLVRDVTDIPVVLAAIHAGVDYFVTNDRDLTVQDETTAQLRRRLKAMLVGTFLHQVMGWSQEELEAVRGRTWDEVEG